MNIKIFCCISFLWIAFSGCKKDFLSKKSSSNILTPTSIEELNGLLENQSVMNLTSGLPQISADEYNIVSDQNYNALQGNIERNAYIWASDLYEGQTNLDWQRLFSQVFYANSVLQVLRDKDLENKTESRFTRGWAYFIRAYVYYDLVRNFSPVYNAATATNDLGMPIRLNAGIDDTEPRSSVQQTFDQIFEDLDIALSLLDAKVPELNQNRPSKAAVWALRARMLLYMGNYEQAGIAADSCLFYHNKVIDYNTVNKTSATPFTPNNNEVIYQSNQIIAYAATSGYNNRPGIEIPLELYNRYDDNDLRKTIFFTVNTIGRYNVKRGYVGTGLYGFTGLATDEVLLIKAECQARQGLTAQALITLNSLLIKRYAADTFIPVSAGSAEQVLDIILLERRKELIWRALRWSDLKRLNRDGHNITLTRTINNMTYTLSPNDPRYVFPIPEAEVAASGLLQNPR